MLELQNIIALLILGVALIYAATMLWKKVRAFSAKTGCADDCGCSSKSKTPKIAH